MAARDPRQPAQPAWHERPEYVHDCGFTGLGNPRGELKGPIGAADGSPHRRRRVGQRQGGGNGEHVAGENRQPDDAVLRVGNRETHQHDRIGRHVEGDVEIPAERRGSIRHARHNAVEAVAQAADEPNHDSRPRVAGRDEPGCRQRHDERSRTDGIGRHASPRERAGDRHHRTRQDGAHPLIEHRVSASRVASSCRPLVRAAQCPVRAGRSGQAPLRSSAQDCRAAPRLAGR